MNPTPPQTTLSTQFKNALELHRYPRRKHELLQAWDSADELLLEHLDPVELTSQNILIVGDSFGALSGSLDGFKITTYTDSYVSTKAIQINTTDKVLPIHELKDFSGIYDLVLIKLPNNQSFFEDILCHLTPYLGPHSRVVCAGMIKHMAKSSFDLLNQYIGETTTSLARKKARLIFATFTRGKVISPYPLTVSMEYFEKPFLNHSNLFSREKLDVGTRFFLEHIPQGPYQKILDLGCGNGVVGIMAKKLNPGAEMRFSDDSAMAIQSAVANYSTFFSDKANFIWTNCFEAQEADSLDLVLCNPPFHQQNAIGDFIAGQMFRDAFHALNCGGKLRVIGNTHLDYPLKLKKIFGNSRVVATHSKFVIVDSVKQGF